MVGMDRDDDEGRGGPDSRRVSSRLTGALKHGATEGVPPSAQDTLPKLPPGLGSITNAPAQRKRAKSVFIVSFHNGDDCDEDEHSQKVASPVSTTTAAAEPQPEDSLVAASGCEGKASPGSPACLVMRAAIDSLKVTPRHKDSDASGFNSDSGKEPPAAEGASPAPLVPAAEVLAAAPVATGRAPRLKTAATLRFCKTDTPERSESSSSPLSPASRGKSVARSKSFSVEASESPRKSVAVTLAGYGKSDPKAEEKEPPRPIQPSMPRKSVTLFGRAPALQAEGGASGESQANGGYIEADKIDQFQKMMKTRQMYSYAREALRTAKEGQAGMQAPARSSDADNPLSFLLIPWGLNQKNEERESDGPKDDSPKTTGMDRFRLAGLALKKAQHKAHIRTHIGNVFMSVSAEKKIREDLAAATHTFLMTSNFDELLASLEDLMEQTYEYEKLHPTTTLEEVRLLMSGLTDGIQEHRELEEALVKQMQELRKRGELDEDLAGEDPDVVWRRLLEMDVIVEAAKVKFQAFLQLVSKIGMPGADDKASSQAAAARRKTLTKGGRRNTIVDDTDVETRTEMASDALSALPDATIEDLMACLATGWEDQNIRGATEQCLDKLRKLGATEEDQDSILKVLKRADWKKRVDIGVALAFKQSKSALESIVQYQNEVKKKMRKIAPEPSVKRSTNKQGISAASMARRKSVKAIGFFSHSGQRAERGPGDDPKRGPAEETGSRFSDLRSRRRSVALCSLSSPSSASSPPSSAPGSPKGQQQRRKSMANSVNVRSSLTYGIEPIKHAKNKQVFSRSFTSSLAKGLKDGRDDSSDDSEGSSPSSSSSGARPARGPSDLGAVFDDEPRGTSTSSSSLSASSACSSSDSKSSSDAGDLDEDERRAEIQMTRAMSVTGTFDLQISDPELLVDCEAARQTFRDAIRSTTAVPADAVVLVEVSVASGEALSDLPQSVQPKEVSTNFELDIPEELAISGESLEALAGCVRGALGVSAEDATWEVVKTDDGRSLIKLNIKSQAGPTNRSTGRRRSSMLKVLTDGTGNSHEHAQSWLKREGVMALLSSGKLSESAATWMLQSLEPRGGEALAEDPRGVTGRLRMALNSLREAVTAVFGSVPQAAARLSTCGGTVGGGGRIAVLRLRAELARLAPPDSPCRRWRCGELAVLFQALGLACSEQHTLSPFEFNRLGDVERWLTTDVADRYHLCELLRCLELRRVLLTTMAPAECTLARVYWAVCQSEDAAALGVQAGSDSAECANRELERALKALCAECSWGEWALSSAGLWALVSTIRCAAAPMALRVEATRLLAEAAGSRLHASRSQDASTFSMAGSFHFDSTSLDVTSAQLFSSTLAAPVSPRQLSGVDLHAALLSELWRPLLLGVLDPDGLTFFGVIHESNEGDPLTAVSTADGRHDEPRRDMPAGDGLELLAGDVVIADETASAPDEAPDRLAASPSTAAAQRPAGLHVGDEQSSAGDADMLAGRQGADDVDGKFAHAPQSAHGEAAATTDSASAGEARGITTGNEVQPLGGGDDGVFAKADTPVPGARVRGSGENTDTGSVAANIAAMDVGSDNRVAPSPAPRFETPPPLLETPPLILGEEAQEESVRPKRTVVRHRSKERSIESGPLNPQLFAACAALLADVVQVPGALVGSRLGSVLGQQILPQLANLACATAIGFGYPTSTAVRVPAWQAARSTSPHFADAARALRVVAQEDRQAAFHRLQRLQRHGAANGSRPHRALRPPLSQGSAKCEASLLGAVRSAVAELEGLEALCAEPPKPQLFEKTPALRIAAAALQDVSVQAFSTVAAALGGCRLLRQALALAQRPPADQDLATRVHGLLQSWEAARRRLLVQWQGLSGSEPLTLGAQRLETLAKAASAVQAAGFAACWTPDAADEGEGEDDEEVIAEDARSDQAFSELESGFKDDIDGNVLRAPAGASHEHDGGRCKSVAGFAIHEPMPATPTSELVGNEGQEVEVACSDDPMPFIEDLVLLRLALRADRERNTSAVQGSLPEEEQDSFLERAIDPWSFRGSRPQSRCTAKAQSSRSTTATPRLPWRVEDVMLPRPPSSCRSTPRSRARTPLVGASGTLPPLSRLATSPHHSAAWR